MPKKRSASTSDSDSGPEDRAPVKKGKPEKSKAEKSSSDGDARFPLDGRKSVTVREFRGTLFVDIREFYEKDGEQLPGKKGISLSVSNWNKLKDLIPKIDDEVSKH